MKISEFISENLQFLVVKFSIYLNRCVFIMKQIKEGAVRLSSLAPSAGLVKAILAHI